MRRAAGEFKSCARVAMEPDGLLGLAMAMILVRGVIAASRRSKGNCKIVGGLHGDEARVGGGGIDLVHRVGGHRQKQVRRPLRERFRRAHEWLRRRRW